MAYIDKNELQNFPFTGEFYRSTVDKSLPPSQQVEEEEVIARVNCDIQEGSNGRTANTVKAVYEVFVPFDSDATEIPVQRGHLFRGTQYGLLVAGKVIGVFPSQLGTLENYFEVSGEEHHCRGYIARVEATDV